MGDPPPPLLGKIPKKYRFFFLKTPLTHFYRTQVSLVRSMGPVLSNKLRDVVADLTDVTLVDEDTKSILTDNANRAIQGNVAMHVTHPVNLVVKF